MHVPRSAGPRIPISSTFFLRFAFCFLASWFSASAARASSVLHVSASASVGGDGLSWATAFNDLQLALTAAQQPGSAVAEIWVAAGIYKPTRRTVAADPRSVTFQLVSGVGLYGGFVGGEIDRDQRDPQANATVLSGDLANNDGPNFSNMGENTYHVVKAFYCSSATVLDGFNIQSGNANTTASFTSDHSGGGIHVQGGGPIISRCHFTACIANGYGSGAYLLEATSHISDSTFVGNRGNEGAGAAATGGSVEIRDCVFEANEVNLVGGGLALRESEALVVGCRFTGNYSGNWGGGFGQHSSVCAIVNCVFEENQAGNYGGGLYSAWDVDVTGCTFRENHSSLRGGGFYANDGRTRLTDCLFVVNSASQFGGGAYSESPAPMRVVGCRFFANAGGNGGGVWWGSVTEGATLTNSLFVGNTGFRGGALYLGWGSRTITNCTFSHNSVGSGGGAVYSAGSPNYVMRVANCIFWRNDVNGVQDQAAQVWFQSAIVQFEQTLLQGWNGSYGGIGNFSADPKFIDSNGLDDLLGTPDDDFRLLAGSPAIDAGNNLADSDATASGVQSLPGMDLDARPRITDHPATPDTGLGGPPVVDLGAYEFQDCNGNGVPDHLDIVSGTSGDCSGDGRPDECDADCNFNGQPDTCDAHSGLAADCNSNGTPDECEPDCDGSGTFDACELSAGTSDDCNGNGIPDGCDLAAGTSVDANADGTPDECRRIIYVNHAAGGANNGTSWTDAFTELQPGLSAASASTALVREVWLAAGIYRPAQPGGSRTATFELKQRVELYGGFAGWESEREQRDPAMNTTTLSGDLNGDDGPDFTNMGENSYHVLTDSAGGFGIAPVLDGFVVTGGNANGGTTSQKQGGGLYGNTGFAEIANCRFVANTATSEGGALAFMSGHRQISNCTFETNRSLTSGGAISNGAWLDIRDSSFLDNLAGGAGAILDLGGYLKLRDCVFTANRATASPSYAGAISFSSGSPQVLRCEFRANVAVNAGAIYHSTGSPVILDCLFLGNGSELFSSTGGAIWLSEGSALVGRCRFVGNRATSRGGSVYVFGGFVPADHLFFDCVFSGNVGPGAGLYVFNGGVARLVNCTLGSNRNSGASGAGINLTNNGAATIANCILWGNTSASGANQDSQIRLTSGATAAISFSTIQGWTGALGGVGNSGDDPRFADADGADDLAGTEDDDLRLTDWSPAIDAGNNAGVLADFADLDGNGDSGEPSPVDLAGAARRVDDPATLDTGAGVAPQVDQGAYEFQHPAAPGAMIVSAASRKVCDLGLNVIGAVSSEPRVGGMNEAVIVFDTPPGAPGPGAVLVERKTCAAPGAYAPYAGAAQVTSVVQGNQLHLLFAPALENAATYRLRLGSTITSLAGQALEARVLLGDLNGDGWVNGGDRSVVTGVWTAPGSYSCLTDLNSSGSTNGNDRSIVIGAWTGTQNCAP